MTPRLEILVRDEVETCPYFPDRRARMPYRLPLQALSPQETDESLAQGDRRQGPLLYRTACPSCRACEPIRLDVTRFTPRRRHRRVLRRGDRELVVERGEPLADRERFELYHRHKLGRGLDPASRVEVSHFAHALVERCVDAFELRFRHQGRLVGAAIVDRGKTALSSVYCYYDPTLRYLGIGTYSILKQVELCHEWGKRHLYLGLYIADSRPMRYKASFTPHERLIDGRWARIEPRES